MHRKYNNKRENRNGGEVERTMSLIVGLALMYFLFTFFTNKAKFWFQIYNYIIPGIIILILIIVLFIFYLYKKKENNKDNFKKIIQNIKDIGFDKQIENFIERFGKEGKSEIFKYRDYNFDDKRLDDFYETFIKNGIKIKKDENETLFEIIKYYIDNLEKVFLDNRIGARVSHNINELNKNGDDFENLIVRLYNSMGYISKRIGGHGDQGGDVIASKDGENILIQAKCYQGSVGNAAVQQATAAIPHYGCTKAVVVTTSYFTLEAVSLAKSNNVELIDGEMLKRKLLEYLKESWQ